MKILEINRCELYIISKNEEEKYIEHKLKEAGFDLSRPIFRTNNIGALQIICKQEEVEKTNDCIECKTEVTVNIGCEYCNHEIPLVIGRDKDQGIVIKHKNGLIAYGYDFHGVNNHNIFRKINYCPICGRRLGEEK